MSLLVPGFERQAAPDGRLHEAIREHLGQRGASFWQQIRMAAVGTTDAEMLAALWDLVWAGEVTNDSLAPLRAVLGGGREKIDKQHERGKLTARERIALLVDEGSFVELGLHGQPHFSQRAMDGVQAPADGVITGWGDVEAGFAQSDYVREDRFESHLRTHGYLEPQVTTAHWDNDRLNVWTSSMGTFIKRAKLARTLDLPYSAVRVHKAYVGGTFGGKIDLYSHEYCAARLSMLTRRPVSPDGNRRRNMESLVAAHERLWHLRHPNSDEF